MQALAELTNLSSAQRSARAVVESALPVSWFVRRHMRSYRKGLSVPQFRTLVFVDLQPKTSLSAVADFLVSSLPNASRIVAGLVRKGLITRQDCVHDRRQLSLALTGRGQSVLAAARQGTNLRVAEQMSLLSRAQCATIDKAMAILKTAFGGVGLDGQLRGEAICGGNGTAVNGRPAPAPRAAAAHNGTKGRRHGMRAAAN